MTAVGAFAGWAWRRLPRRPRPVILMYHRVADRPCDPWGLCVKPERFSDQLAAIVRERTPLSLSEFVDRCLAASIPDDAVAVTFDDGYADNVRTAAPLLHQAGVPATIFVTSGTIGGGAPFWWDRLAQIVFAPGPLRGSLRIGDRTIAIDRPEMAASDTPRPSWRAFEPTRSTRARLYVELWQAMQQATPEQCGTAIAELEHWRYVPPPHPNDLPMSSEELTTLHSPLVEVSAHGVTHRRLTSCNTSEQHREIALSRATISCLSGADSASFAYPHGDHDDSVRVAAREAGIRRACTTRAAAIDIKTIDPMALPRLAIGNWSGSDLLRRMSALRI